MSYNLGNWAKKLTCELCDKMELELDVPDDFYDDYEPWDDPDWYSGDDEESGDEWYDDLEVPGADLPGGGRATPDWNSGPGIEFEWNW